MLGLYVHNSGCSSRKTPHIFTVHGHLLPLSKQGLPALFHRLSLASHAGSPLFRRRLSPAAGSLLESPLHAHRCLLNRADSAADSTHHLSSICMFEQGQSHPKHSEFTGQDHVHWSISIEGTKRHYAVTENIPAFQQQKPLPRVG